MADISGYAIQWNQPAVIGGLFEERFAKGAFDKSLVDRPDVVALWGHDSTRPLGRVSNGSLRVLSDSVGLWYSLKPNDGPLGQEAIATVGSGTVNEVSVGFSSQVEEWDDREDVPRRLITQATLFELSLVLWGAYGKATSAAIAGTRHSQLAKMEAAMRARGIPLK
ncbi:HK97 family phage prohead protease [Rhizobium sp. Root1220]|uniref:HK97 family phage prohead protease n=1 Tax=Rhizobium sp. Root1220 TaxID=1736432 RepID=UPI000700584F|nr:HK97 family phage prohead protease [Rhizobium sp. Root1220]KQV83656.1 peptidase [Rhizobium sp. Root1220]